MPNVSIDNVSPLIQYQPGWTEGSIPNDPLWFEYSAGTFTLCTSSGASTTFSFNGTAIWLFGAKRGNHDLYNVTLDGVLTTSNGSSTIPVFQAPLFSASNLANTLHTVTLTNAGTQLNRGLDYLDLDYITWETNYGLDTQQLKETIIQDTDSSFSYQPRGAWTNTVTDLSQYVGNSGHETYNDGAYVTLSITGDAVEIYGSVGPNSATYTVQLDGGSISTYNATKTNKITPVPIYYADNLGAGVHNVKITHTSVTETQGLFINYARVISASDASTGVSTPVNNGSHASGPSVSVIAGAVAGSLAFVAILACIFVWWRRSRQTAQTHTPTTAQHFSTASQITPYISLQSIPPSSTNYPYPNSQSYDSQASRDGQNHRDVNKQRKGVPAQLLSTASPSSDHAPETDRTHNVFMRRNSTPTQSSVAGPSSEIHPLTHTVGAINVHTRHRPVGEEMPPPEYSFATES